MTTSILDVKDSPHWHDAIRACVAQLPHLAHTDPHNDYFILGYIARAEQEDADRSGAADKIKVTYYGDEAPRIEASPEDMERIELIDGEEESNLVLDRGGVQIYVTYKHGDCLSSYWFSTMRGTDWDDDHAFDIRDLPDLTGDDIRSIYRELYPDSPDKQKLAFAIDAGLIDQDGRVGKEEVGI